MNIMICSAKDAAHQLRVQPHHWHVISLRCMDNRIEFEKVEQLRHLAKVMIVRRFDDVWDGQHEQQGFILPSKDDVLACLNFVSRYRPANLLVHCYAGVSRSSAMAYVIACKKKDPKEAIKMLNQMIHMPNERIVKLGAELLENDDIWRVYKEEFGKDLLTGLI